MCSAPFQVRQHHNCCEVKDKSTCEAGQGRRRAGQGLGRARHLQTLSIASSSGSISRHQHDIARLLQLHSCHLLPTSDAELLPWLSFYSSVWSIRKSHKLRFILYCCYKSSYQFNLPCRWQISCSLHQPIDCHLNCEQIDSCRTRMLTCATQSTAP